VPFTLCLDSHYVVVICLQTAGTWLTCSSVCILK